MALEKSTPATTGTDEIAGESRAYLRLRHALQDTLEDLRPPATAALPGAVVWSAGTKNDAAQRPLDPEKAG